METPLFPHPRSWLSFAQQRSNRARSTNSGAAAHSSLARSALPTIYCCCCSSSEGAALSERAREHSALFQKRKIRSERLPVTTCPSSGPFSLPPTSTVTPGKCCFSTYCVCVCVCVCVGAEMNNLFWWNMEAAAGTSRSRSSSACSPPDKAAR